MKKQYIAPLMELDREEEQQMLCSSPINSDLGIGYGGVDEEGVKDPDARGHSSLWDEE